MQTPMIRPGLSLPASLARKPRVLPKPQDPEAFATLINLLARYAQGAPARTSLDLRVERAFSGWALGRSIAQRMVRTFDAIPLDRREELLGRDHAQAARIVIPEPRQLAALVRLQGLHLPPRPTPPDDGEEGGYHPPRLEPTGQPGGSNAPDAAPAPAPAPRPNGGARVARSPTQLYYRGFYCREESDFDRFTDSDEIFVVSTVIYQVGDENRVKTLKHPIDAQEYEDIDSGEWKRGPTALCWSGSRRPLSLAVHVFESDDQNPQEYADEVRAAVTLGLAALGAAVPAAAPLAMSDGVKDAITTLIQFLLASGADLIGDAYRDFSVGQIMELEGMPARIGRKSRIPYHFRTSHVGDGANYAVYFTFGR